MCARTDPNLNLLKKNYEDHSPLPREAKTIQKRKRLGEMYISTDELDRLTLQASTFQTHSDEELPLKSHCFRHLTNRAGPSVHLCWQFDDAHRAEEKSGELITAINRVVKILKSLDADEDEHSGPASDVQNGVPSNHGNAMPSGHATEKEPEKDYDTKENDSDSMKLDSFVSPESEKSGPGTPLPECEAPASRVEEAICDRDACEHAVPEIGCESSESAGSHVVSVLHSSALKSVYQAPDDHQPEHTMVLAIENVHEGSGEEESVLHNYALKSVYQAPDDHQPEDTMLQLEYVHERSGEHESVLHSSALKSVYKAPDDHQPEVTMPLENVLECSGQEQSKFEGLATAPADDALTPERNKGPELACESDCEIMNLDSDAPPGFEKYKASDTESDSDEEMDEASPSRDEQRSEERETPNLRTGFHGLEIKAECSVHFQMTNEDDKCPGSQHSALDDQRIRRENLSIPTSDLEGKIPATSIEGADKLGETYLLQWENTKDSSSESSDNGLLYEDEQMFHDSVRELKRKSSKFHEVFIMGLRSGGDHLPNSKFYHYDETHELANRKEASRLRRLRRLRHATEIVTLPEVDRIFSGEKWKTFDPRVRVKTILDQFHYLVNYFRLEGLESEKVKGSRGRPDVLAGKYLMAKRFCFNEGWSMVGNIPGVEVGDTFMYREELLILIVHRTSQAGIEYIPASKSGYYDKNGCPAAVAVSVVSSGGYRDNEDDGETMTYIGSGGQKNMTHSRCPSEYIHAEKDQELVRGNLALKNSCDLGVPVRMIRGERNSDREVMKKSYWYDGLYDVTKCYEDRGSAGSKVWKFQLVKQKGQRES